MFEHLRILKLQAVFSSQQSGELPPYLGSTLRGIMGHCIRESACVEPNKKCFLCNRSEQCPYAQCFCSPGNDGGAMNPFVLHSFTEGKTKWEPGDECCFELTILGKAVQHAGIYVEALKAMEKKGWGSSRLQFSLQHIVDPERGVLVYAEGRFWIQNLRPFPLSTNERRTKTALLHFDTPLRIIRSGELIQSLPFEFFIQSLSRRIALLSVAFTEQMLCWNEEMFEEAAKVKTVKEKWREIDFSRYSMNQKNNKLDLGAIEGWVMYEGDLDRFVPLLEAGRYLHAGKDSSIGFGHYKISYD